MYERRERILKEHRSSLCGRHARTIGKAAFNFWSLGPSRLVSAARATGARPATERKKFSDLHRRRATRIRGGSPLRSTRSRKIDQQRRAAAAMAAAFRSLSFSLILSLSLLSLFLSRSLFSFSSSYAKNSPATGIPSKGSSLIDFLTYFRLIIPLT